MCKATGPCYCDICQADRKRALLAHMDKCEPCRTGQGLCATGDELALALRDPKAIYITRGSGGSTVGPGT